MIRTIQPIAGAGAIPSAMHRRAATGERSLA
jgi:hypothetical protein